MRSTNRNLVFALSILSSGGAGFGHVVVSSAFQGGSNFVNRFVPEYVKKRKIGSGSGSGSANISRKEPSFSSSSSSTSILSYGGNNENTYQTSRRRPRPRPRNGNTNNSITTDYGNSNNSSGNGNGNRNGNGSNRYSRKRKEAEVPEYITNLIENYNERKRKPLSTSREILYQCEQIRDKPSLEATIDYITSNSVSKASSVDSDNSIDDTGISTNDDEHDDDDNDNDNDAKINNDTEKETIFLASLLTPRDQTNMIRLLGSRGMHYTMLCFLTYLSKNLNLKQKESIANIQYAYAAAIKVLSQSPNPKYRLRSTMLIDEMDKLGVEPNSYVITAAFLSICGGEDARKLINRTKGYKTIEIDVNIYNAAIYACSRNLGHDPSNGWESAVSFFRQMSKEGIQPNQQTYASLLQACAKSGQVKVAFSLFDEMRSTPGLDKPGVKVWGAILRACSVAGDWERAMELTLEMNDEGVEINIIHMNSVLAALAKVGNDMMALTVLDAMQNGQSVSILRTWVSRQNKNESFVDDDKTQLPDPDLVSVNTVLTAFAERSNKSEAMKLLGRMKEGGFTSKHRTKYVVIKPDIISYNTVLSTFDEPEDAVSLLHEIRMTRKNRYNPLKPTCQTYTNAISICSRSDPPNLDIALSLLRDATVKDGLKPNNFMYSSTIWTAERCGDAKTALSLLREMYSQRCKPNTIIYNGVIATFAKNGMFKEATLLFHDMKQKHIPSSTTTFQQLAIAATKSNFEVENIVDGLENILTTLNKQERHVRESGPIYDALIRGYGYLGNFDDALRVFNSITQTSALCLSSILFVCSITSPARWNEAVIILHSSYVVAGAQGPGKIEAMALSYAMIACSKENQWQEAINLLELYGVTNGRQTAAVSVDAINSAIAAAGRCGRPDIAVKTLNEMNFKYSLKPNERTYRSAIVACNQAEHEKRRNRTRTVESSEKDVDNDGRLKAGGGREVEVDEAKDDPLSFEWWEAALSLFRRMKEDQIQPSIQTYSSVISACEAAGQWQRAIGILRSMTETKDTICQPNLFCFNAALAACEKGNAWLEAVELYERMRATGGSIMPNFISMNSLLIALDKGEQRELAESIYKEALKEKILTPWKYTLDSNCDERVRAFDLHQFSIPMAKIAVRNVVDSLLQKRASHDVAKDLIMVLGKGKGSIDGKAKLMPVIKALLKDEYNINASVEENNPGRIRIQSEVLIEFIETRRWQ